MDNAPPPFLLHLHSINVLKGHCGMYGGGGEGIRSYSKKCSRKTGFTFRPALEWVLGKEWIWCLSWSEFFSLTTAKNVLTDGSASANLKVPRHCHDMGNGTMESEKKWLRKPACNPPISQDKAGFVTYSTYEEARLSDSEK